MCCFATAPRVPGEPNYRAGSYHHHRSNRKSGQHVVDMANMQRRRQLESSLWPLHMPHWSRWSILRKSFVARLPLAQELHGGHMHGAPAATLRLHGTMRVRWRVSGPSLQILLHAQIQGFIRAPRRIDSHDGCALLYLARTQARLRRDGTHARVQRPSAPYPAPKLPAALLRAWRLPERPSSQSMV